MFLDKSKLALSHPNPKLAGEIALPSSKSESNRALIIQALGGNKIQLENLSSARDTQTMIRLLKSDDETLDVLDAGTTMRFLTAFCTASNRKTILTGTERMKQRPIGILVDALREIGVAISYLEKEGFPPIQIEKFEQKATKVSIRGDVSSQYISALLLIAPKLPSGLKLELLGEVGSKPYIRMTLSLMERFGVSHTWEGNLISIDNANYKAGDYRIESDWSGASYWYSLIALAKPASEIRLIGLRKDSLQGDKAIVEIGEMLGVSTEFVSDGVILRQKESENSFEFDFTNCPDLAQTVSAICAAKQIPAKLTGLKSLRIKETDRIDAIRNELEKFGAEIKVVGDDELHIQSPNFKVENQTVETYEDHRMAMAFAPLALLGKIQLEEPKVVVKSYPSYWDDLEKIGFEIL